MIETFADFEALVRDTVFANATADMLFCFELTNDDDASENAAGPLLKQDQDFFLFETDITGTRRTAISTIANRRAEGELLISLFTKDKGDPIGRKRRLEEVGAWFADMTVGGVRFRTLQPTGSGPLMGFRTYDAVIPCDFELKRMR